MVLSQEMDLDNENPLEGILSSTMFAIRSMMHYYIVDTVTSGIW